MGEAMFNSISPSTNSVLSALFILLSTHTCVIAFLTKALSMLWRPMVLLFQIPVPSIVYPFTMVNELVFELCTSSALLTHNVCFRSTQRKQYNVWDLNYEPFLTLVTCYSVIDTNVGSAGECVNFLLLTEQCPFNRQSTALIGLELR